MSVVIIFYYVRLKAYNRMLPSIAGSHIRPKKKHRGPLGFLLREYSLPVGELGAVSQTRYLHVPARN